MRPTDRRKWIEKQLSVHKKVDIEEMSKQLNVSTMTIRRDLNEMERDRKVIRTHGGAISVDSITEEVPYSLKKTKNVAEKKAIARKALSLVEKDMTILLDSGTTTFELAKLLKRKSSLTIVTNDIKIANELLDSSNEVIVTGGELQKGVGALYGTATQNMLEVIRADIFFLGAHAIDLHSGVMTPSFEKSLIKQLMIRAAEKTWVLADSSKFDRKAFSIVCDLEGLDGIITDQELASSLVKKYSTKLKLLFAEE